LRDGSISYWVPSLWFNDDRSGEKSDTSAP
jgi:hypothetical protein